MTRKHECYCLECNSERIGRYYDHFFDHPKVVRMCGSEPVLKVSVEELPEELLGCYWSWWSNETQKFLFTHHKKAGVEICFTYGSEAEEERGRGHLLPVKVTVLETVKC